MRRQQNPAAPANNATKRGHSSARGRGVLGVRDNKKPNVVQETYI